MDYHTELMRRAMLEERLLRIECALQLTMDTTNNTADRVTTLERRVSRFFLNNFHCSLCNVRPYCVKKYLYPQSGRGELRFVAYVGYT